LSRELGCGDFVKIEIMRDSKYLLLKGTHND
jgi:thiazole synthase ThiGH ThiG subunit